MSPSSQVDCPLPKRRSSKGDLGGKVRNRTSRFSKSAFAIGLFAAILAAPAAGSELVPVHANAAANSARVYFAAPGEESWVNLSSGGAPEASDLEENPGAASRARLREPIAVRSCVVSEGAANGSRTLSTQKMVNYPMVEGSYRVSSQFGYRFDPISGMLALHTGDDYAAPSGTPILAVADGVVTKAGYDGEAGYFTLIEHSLEDGSTVVSAYMHQLQGSQIVGVGDEVKAGQQIGGVGTTGRSTGNHLHFEIRDATGNKISPSAWLLAQEAVFVGKDC